jgi:hypothetical protein
MRTREQERDSLQTQIDDLAGNRDKVVAEQAALLGGQVPIFPGASDEELKAATDRVRRLYRELRAVPAGRPDERARIWRDITGLVLKAGAAALGAIVVAALVWHLTR